MKIKTWFVWIIAGTVCLFLLIQLCFYFVFQNWNNSMRDSLIEATANQTVSQIQDLYATIEDVALSITTDEAVQAYLYNENSHRFYKNYSTITNNISSTIFANKGIKYVAILDNSDILMNVSQGTDMLYSLSILERVSNDLSKSEWQGSFVKAYQHRDKNCFAYVDHIFSTSSYIETTKGYSIVILFEVEEMQIYLEPVFDQNKFSLTILDYDNRVLASADSDMFGQLFTPAEHLGNFWYTTVKMANPHWQLCLSVPKTYFVSGKSFVIFMLTAILLNVLLLIFLIKILIKNISDSISDIEKEIGIICSGKWEHRIRYNRNNEIGTIAGSFNTLLDEYATVTRANSLMEEEIHAAKLLQLKAQIDQLQERISPHFLYNSMEYIKGVAQEYGVDKIADITSILSQNFRYNMDTRKDVTIKEDIFYALSYFNVINSRRKYPIRLNLNVPREIMEQRIVKMVFQPILENTLKHGELGEDGLVEFSGRVREDGFTEISVRDNGCGIAEETLIKLQESLRDGVNYVEDDKGEHHGILNVHMRLKLSYGAGCGITILSQYGQGTEIIITIRHL